MVICSQKKKKITKEDSIINFQNRICDLIVLEDTPLVEKIKFIKIILSNLDEFLSVRLQNSEDLSDNIDEISELYCRLGLILSDINSVYQIKELKSEISSKKIYMNDISFIYTGENDIQSYVDLSEVLDTQESSHITLYSEGYDSTALYNIQVEKCLFEIDNYLKIYKEKYPHEIYHQEISMIPHMDYYDLIQNHDILIRVPYESYHSVTEFIDQMCTHKQIHTVFITLYRTASHSVIIDSLLKAKRLNKNVFVYVEPTARGNEKDNLETIIKLREAGIIVNSNYFNYKVHSKVFCAIDKEGHKYVHIGTGNYNENTANHYTDCHLLTCNEEIGNEITRVILSIFQKTVYLNRNIKSPIHNSPVSLRSQILEMIRFEEEKGVHGRIWIKCNNLYDDDVINALYKASDNGVDVRIICRTRCGIVYPSNLEVRSKVGQYLEHERIYIFGEKCYISSADLLVRNISKRVEILCQVPKQIELKIETIFLSVWNSDHIHRLTEDGRWEVT